MLVCYFELLVEFGVLMIADGNVLIDIDYLPLALNYF